MALHSSLTHTSCRRSRKTTRSSLVAAAYKFQNHSLSFTFRALSSYKRLTPRRPPRLAGPLFRRRFNTNPTHTAAASYLSPPLERRPLSQGLDLRRQMPRSHNSSRINCSIRLKGPSKECRTSWGYHTPICRDTHRLRTSSPMLPVTGKNHFHP